MSVEEGSFPSYQSLEKGETALEEERRLFYVAMTRAKQKLQISYARGRMLWGQVRTYDPSQFLSEIHLNLQCGALVKMKKFKAMFLKILEEG
jgi:superfamily I DNA/RNA helicase